MGRTFTASVLAIAIGLAAGCAAAQITIEADETPLDTVLSQIAEQSGERIVAGPSAFGSVTCKLACPTPEEALAAVCATMNLEYRKVHLPLAEDETISGSDLEDIVAALEAVQRTGVIIEGSKDDATLIFSQKTPPPGDAASLAPKDSKAYVLIYLVRSPKSGKPETKRTPKVSELVEMEKDRILAHSSLSDEEQDELAKRNIDLFFSLDPQLRSQAMMGQMRMMANMTPDQRREMGQIMRSVWQDMPSNLRQRFEDMRGRRDRGDRPPRG